MAIGIRELLHNRNMRSLLGSSIVIKFLSHLLEIFQSAAIVAWVEFTSLMDFHFAILRIISEDPESTLFLTVACYLQSEYFGFFFLRSTRLKRHCFFFIPRGHVYTTMDVTTGMHQMF